MLDRLLKSAFFFGTIQSKKNGVKEGRAMAIYDNFGEVRTPFFFRSQDIFGFEIIQNIF